MTKIKDLALEAIVKHPASSHWVFTDEELEHFADLIVQECASICYKNWPNGDEIAGLLLQTFGKEL